jgi:CheY-like chemotaxis protein
MAIIAGIVRDNDAALVLDTAPGKGTRTTIFWPVEPVQEQAPHHPRAEKRGARLDGAMVLVVDDDPAVCEVLSAIVEAAGAMAVSTTNPQEALQSLTESPDDWHVLVTDHDMPGLSGGALVRKAKALRTTLPCILVSALPERAGAERALFDAILAKPVQASDLVAAISDALERRRSAPVHRSGDPG